MTYIICGIPCIEVCMESDHKKSFFYAGRYFVKLSDYYAEDDEKWIAYNAENLSQINVMVGYVRVAITISKVVEKYTIFQQREQ